MDSQYVQECSGVKQACAMRSLHMQELCIESSESTTLSSTAQSEQSS